MFPTESPKRLDGQTCECLRCLIKSAELSLPGAAVPNPRFHGSRVPPIAASRNMLICREAPVLWLCPGTKPLCTVHVLKKLQQSCVTLPYFLFSFLFLQDRQSFNPIWVGGRRRCTFKAPRRPPVALKRLTVAPKWPSHCTTQALPFIHSFLSFQAESGQKEK